MFVVALVASACRVGADVAILISGSGIVGSDNYQLMLDFTRQLVYGVNVNRKDSQISVVVFSDDAYVRFYLNDFNDFTLSTSSSFPNDYVYTQIHALSAISNHYPYALLRVTITPQTTAISTKKITHFRRFHVRFHANRN